MEAFRTLYFEYCKNYNVEPQECVKAELKRLVSVTDENSYTLNLSTNHITDKTCMILAKLLTHDQQICTLKLNDCSLSFSGLRDICHALTTNTAIRILELKGNNIHGDGTEILAKLLRHNTSIRSFSLEWNSIGLMDTNAFPLFCESLTINKSLQDLDLRNNQITHTGMLELCAALEKNSTLKILDLRWNSVGLVGGKGLLSLLKKNHSITQLLTTGNNIPEDIADAINIAIGHNHDKQKSTTEFNVRTTTLTKELQNVQVQKDKHINQLLNKIDLQEQAGRQLNRTMNDKLKKLHSAFEDHNTTINSLSSKLSMTEADLALSEQKCADLTHLVQRMELEKENQMQLANMKFKRDKEELIQDKQHIEKELNDVTARNLKLDDKVKELERKCNELTALMYDAKEKLAQGQAEYQIKMSVLDEESRRLKQKHRDELKDYELNKNKEVARLRDEYDLSEKDLKDRCSKLEMIKHNLEDEVSHLKAQLSTQKVNHEQELQEQKSRLQLEEMQKKKDLEDKVRNAQQSREDLEVRYSHQNVTITDLQQKNSSLTLEIETVKRNNDSLRNQLAEKENELIESVEKLKTDQSRRLRAIQKDIDRTDELKEEISKLEIKLKDTEADSKRELRNLEHKLTESLEKIKNREEEIERLKQADEQRDLRLQTMLTTILNETKTKRLDKSLNV